MPSGKPYAAAARPTRHAHCARHHDPLARTDDPGQLLDELIRAAKAAGVPVYTLSPREIVGSTVAAPSSDEWRRYTEQSRETLRALASQTAGVAAIDPAGLEKALEQLRDFGR